MLFGTKQYLMAYRKTWRYEFEAFYSKNSIKEGRVNE